MGYIGETQIGKWLRRRGNVILATYETEMQANKGVRLFGSRELIAPDLLCFAKNGNIFWAEAKEKISVCWYRKTQKWQTGIDIRHWDDYRQVSLETKLPVCIFFLHLISEPRPEDLAADPDCPRECPTGLYGASLEFLEKLEAEKNACHRSPITRMIYWDVDALQKLAEVSEVSEL